MDSGSSFDAFSEVYGGEGLALAVGSGKVRGGRGSVFGEGAKRAGSHREQDGGDSFPATTDSSIKQQYRTAFCALNHTRSSYKPAIIMWIASCRSMLLRKCMGGRTWPLRLEMATKL